VRTDSGPYSRWQGTTNPPFRAEGET